MDCPCETCLVRPVCGNRLIQKTHPNQFPCLIVEYAEECPYILDYFGINSSGHIDHDYDKIYKLCRLFAAHKGFHFVWKANQLN
jgi:hypothetical protein